MIKDVVQLTGMGLILRCTCFCFLVRKGAIDGNMELNVTYYCKVKSVLYIMFFSLCHHQWILSLI